MVTKQRDNRTIGYGETVNKKGNASSGDQEQDGSFSYTIMGRSPKGEQNTIRVCEILIKKLNAEGASWGSPEHGREEPADCECADIQQKHKILKIQVVQALNVPKFWENLEHTEMERQFGVSREEIVNQLFQTIQFKANKYSVVVRREHVLALDATRFPAFGFDDVVDHFHSNYGALAISLQFQAIWIVGPSTRLSHRLDYTVSKGES